jgi:predicted patatin/cPLA2 family phospholipase
MRQVLRAACSLPVVSPPVIVNGRYYLDGGISDSIPVRQSAADGNKRHVIILTRHAGYRKQQPKAGLILRLLLRHYPELAKSILTRYIMYNDQLSLVDTLEAQGSAFVFRPGSPIRLSRFEKNSHRLQALYDQGCRETARRISDLKKWLHTPGISVSSR